VAEASAPTPTLPPPKQGNPKLKRASTGGESAAATQDWTLIQEQRKEKVRGEAAVPEKELEQQVTARSSQPREYPKPRSPKPSSPRPRFASPVHAPQAADVTDSPQGPATHAVFEDQSMEVEARDVGMGMSMEATEQWREGVVDHDFAQDDEDGVCHFFVDDHLVANDCFAICSHQYLLNNSLG
jgi:hypothetical protein